MSAKDKVVATLLNHWYCQNRIEEFGKLKKKPAVAKYEERLGGIDAADDKALKVIDDHFCSQNRKLLVGVFGLLFKQAGIEDLNVEADAKSKGIKLSMPVKDFVEAELNQYLSALRGPDQLEAIKLLLANSAKFVGAGSESILTHEVKCTRTEFYDSIAQLEKSTEALILGAIKLLSICRLMREKMTPTDLKEVVSGQIFVNFKSIEFDGSKISSSAFETAETPEAKASRELAARLQEALLKQIKKVRDLAVSAGSITYNFENTEVDPLTFNLDIITDW